MPRRTLILTAILIILTGCVETHYTHIDVEGYPEERLVHSVYLDLLDSLDQSTIDRVIQDLYSLDRVEGVEGLTVQERIETGDQRMPEGFDLVLQMSFEGRKHLEDYSKDPLHLEVRSRLKGLLNGAPVVYDAVVVPSSK